MIGRVLVPLAVLLRLLSAERVGPSRAYQEGFRAGGLRFRTTSGDGHEHCAICFPCCPSGMCSIMYCLVHICPKAKILGFCCTGLVEHVMLTWTSRGDRSRKKINDIFRCPDLDGMGFVAGTSVRFEQNFRRAVHSYLGLCLSRCNMNRTCLESSAAQECFAAIFCQHVLGRFSHFHCARDC